MTKSRDNRDDHDPGRRKFLKGVGIVGAGAAIADHLWVEAEAAESSATPESLSGTVKVVLDVNGQKREAQVEPRTTLLNTLRNHLEPAVTGPKLVCDVGTCGACTVLLDGKPAYSCLCSQSMLSIERSQRSKDLVRRRVRTLCKLRSSSRTR